MTPTPDIEEREWLDRVVADKNYPSDFEWGRILFLLGGQDYEATTIKHARIIIDELRSRLQESVDEVRVLSTQVVDVEDQLFLLRSRLQEAEAALQSLTPGGSEFVNDPWRCVKFARDARDIEHAALMKKHARLQEAEKVVGAARAIPIKGDVDAGLSAELKYVMDWLGDQTISDGIRLILNNWRGGIGYIRQIREALAAYDSTLGGKTE